MTSAIAIINARRVWRGGLATSTRPADGDHHSSTASYFAGCDAVLVDGGTIAFVGSTNAVLERFARLRERIERAQQAQHSDGGDDATTTVAVTGGRRRRPFARVIDCQHRYAVLPGFIDSHVHLLDGGRRLRSPQLDLANSRASFVATLRAHVATSAAASAHDDGWLYGGGWSEAVLGTLPTREWLDEVCAERPTVLFSKDSHSCVTNTAVLRLCGLLPSSPGNDDDNNNEDKTTATPFVVPTVSGGRIECDARGVPNGVLRDNAIQALLRPYMPTKDTYARQCSALEAATTYFLSRGFTMVCSMMSMLYADNIHEVRFLQDMERRGELRLRVRYAVPAYETTRLVTELYMPLLTARGNSNSNDDDNAGDCNDNADDHDDDDAFLLPYRFTALPPRRGGGYCVLGAIKILSDGSLSSRTAAMTRPYGYDVLTDGDLDSDVDDDGAAALAAAAAMRVREAAAAASSTSSSESCQCGMLLMSPAALHDAIALAHAHHLQCCVHAIGDRAVATTNKALAASSVPLLAQCDAAAAAASHEQQSSSTSPSLLRLSPALEAAVRASVSRPARWRERVAAFCANPRSRVEHCQHIANVDKELRRMRAHHLIASMQPNQLLFDGDYIDELLGSRRKARAYLWRTLLKHDVHVALGSDWPVAPADVNDGLRGAVTRVPDVMSSLAEEAAAAAVTANNNNSDNDNNDNSGSRRDGVARAQTQAMRRRYHAVWNADECLSLTEALCTYTYESAYAAFMDAYVGTIDVGKYADLTIWSDDLLDTTAHVALGDDVDDGNRRSDNSSRVPRWWRPGSEPRVLYTIVGGCVEYEASTPPAA